MWASADPQMLHRVWGEYLGGFEQEDIREALGAMPMSYKDFPPTLPQFGDLCMDAKRRRMSAFPKLVPPKTDMPEGVRAQLHAFVRKATK